MMFTCFKDFSSVYINIFSDSGFSAMLVINSKSRNKFDTEYDMRCALSKTEPWVENIELERNL